MIVLLHMSKEVTRARFLVSLSNPANDAKLHKYNTNEYLRDKSDAPPDVSEFPGLLEWVSMNNPFVIMERWGNEENEGKPYSSIGGTFCNLQKIWFDLF